MNKQELLEAVAKESGLEMTKKDSEIYLNSLIEVIKKTVKKGEDVSLVGFGSFVRQARKARMAQNPSTGEKMKIKAKKVPKFRPGLAFKELVNGKK